jgi:hypothetical protein
MDRLLRRAPQAHWALAEHREAPAPQVALVVLVGLLDDLAEPAVTVEPVDRAVVALVARS